MNFKKILSVVLTLVMAFSFVGCVNQHPEEVSSNTRQSTVEYIGKEDYRIAATSVSTLEVLEALGVESEHVVGIPHTDAFEIPEIYANAQDLGTPMSPDTEILSSLDVDIVLSPQSIQSTFNIKKDYDNAGIKSYFLDLSSVEGMYNSMYDIGVMLGKEDKAEELCKDFEAFKKEIESKTKDSQPPKVLIIMGLPGSAKLAATEKSYAGNLVKLAGGENIYGNLEGDAEGFVNVDIEDMAAKDPDMIFITAHANPELCMEIMRDEISSEDSPWQHFRAVEEGQVYELDYRKFGMSANLKYRQAIDDLQGVMFGE